MMRTLRAPVDTKVGRSKAAARTITLLAAAAAAVPVSTAAASTPRFSAPVVIDTGRSWERSMISADLNGDRNPDLAMTGGAAGAVTVLYGDGAGGFRLQAYPGTGVADVAAGDVSGDGRPDLVGVWSNSTAAVVVVFVNEGNGVFRRQRHEIPGAEVDMVAVGDLNRDGLADVAIGGYRGLGDFTVMFATGAGRLSAPIMVGDAESPGGRDVVIADLNADGFGDVALAALGSRAARVRLGAGGGTFGPAATFGASRGDATSLVPAQLSGDGTFDLVVGREAGVAGVLLGTGAGSFGAQTDYRMSRSFGDGAVLVGDFDGDRVADIADSGAADWNPMSVRLGAGDGTFGRRRDLPSIKHYTSRVGEDSNTSPEVVDDFNRDGRLDVALSVIDGTQGEDSASRRIAVLLNWTGLPARPCVVVPVSTESLREATRHLRNAGCRVGKVTLRSSGTSRRPRVISQQPAYGSVLRPHSRVDLVVRRSRPPA
jgi:hypothetical protein